MKLGLLKDIKEEEYRVALTPEAVGELVLAGVDVFVQASAGLGSGFLDEEYTLMGATMLPDAAAVFQSAVWIVKVKEPIPEEWEFFEEHHILFSYLHLAAEPRLMSFIKDRGFTALAFETFEGQNGGLPLLEPMSKVAGRVSMQAGMQYLQKHMGGKGVLPCALGKGKPVRALIVGAGNVGREAAAVALGLGANVTLYDRNAKALEAAKEQLGLRLETKTYQTEVWFEDLPDADVVVGAALLPGGRAPILIPEDRYFLLGPKTVLIDVSIDQGGCFGHSNATTHKNPVFEAHGALHYCVANIPAAVPQSASSLLSEAVLPMLLEANKYSLEELIEKEGWKQSLNVHQKKVNLAILLGL